MLYAREHSGTTRVQTNMCPEGISGTTITPLPLKGEGIFVPEPLSLFPQIFLKIKKDKI